jgi:excisionase family DNA binding protein
LDTLLTVEQATERLGTSPRFVRRLVFERRIPYIKLGRHVRITGRDLDAFIAAGRVDVHEFPTLRRGPSHGDDPEAGAQRQDHLPGALP